MRERVTALRERITALRELVAAARERVVVAMSREGDAMRRDPRSFVARVAIGGILGALPVILAIEFDLLADFAWGPSLWRYLPGAAAVLLGLATAAWALLPPLRRRVAEGLELSFRTALRLGRGGPWLGALLLVGALFLLRPRLIFGDSQILLWTMTMKPRLFVFPDIGATFFMHAGFRVGTALGIGGRLCVELLACLCAPIAVLGVWRASRAITPDAQRAGWVVGIALCTALVRVFSGHIEVYAYVIAAAGLYLWAATAHLQGRCGWAVPCLAYGVGVWVHLQFLFLGPSLLFALFDARGPRGARAVTRRLALGGLVALAPTVVFLFAAALFGHGAELQEAVTKLARWGTGDASTGGDVWIRLFEPSGDGTRYRIFSSGHLFYLANAFFLLAPASLWLLLCVGARMRAALFDGPEARFLSAGLVPLLIYCAIVRPVYGPYDWDLFSLTALWTSLTAASALSRTLPARAFLDLATLVTGLAAFTTAIPMLAIGLSARPESGPFSPELAPPELGRSFDDSFERRVAPWI